MATRKVSVKKAAPKKSAKKSTKKTAKKSTKKSSKKSSKKLTRTASLAESPVTGGVEVGFLPPVLRCIEFCADAYGRCLAGGGNPQKCMKTFMSCLQGCLRRGGIGVGGGIGGGGVVLNNE